MVERLHSENFCFHLFYKKIFRHNELCRKTRRSLILYLIFTFKIIIINHRTNAFEMTTENFKKA